VYYFYDLGLRNYAIGRFGLLNDIDMGPVFENFIMNLLKEKIRWSPKKIHFWRTKEKAEVDFVVDYGYQILPIEVKYKAMSAPVIKKSIRSFIEKYSPKYALVINLNLKEKIKIGKTMVIFLPFQDILLWGNFPENF
jgi:hypothetical protein